MGRGALGGIAFGDPLGGASKPKYPLARFTRRVLAPPTSGEGLGRGALGGIAFSDPRWGSFKAKIFPCSFHSQGLSPSHIGGGVGERCFGRDCLRRSPMGELQSQNKPLLVSLAGSYLFSLMILFSKARLSTRISVK